MPGVITALFFSLGKPLLVAGYHLDFERSEYCERPLTEMNLVVCILAHVYIHVLKCTFCHRIVLVWKVSVS